MGLTFVGFEKSMAPHADNQEKVAVVMPPVLLENPTSSQRNAEQVTHDQPVLRSAPQVR